MLIALPPLLARVAVVACLSAGVALLPVVFALAERSGRRRAEARPRAADGGVDGTGGAEAWRTGV